MSAPAATMSRLEQNRPAAARLAWLRERGMGASILVSALAAAFGVSVYTIDSVRRGRTTGATPVATRALTTEQAESIRQRHAAGESQTALAAEFGTSQQAVSQIVRGITYRN